MEILVHTFRKSLHETSYALHTQLVTEQVTVTVLLKTIKTKVFMAGPANIEFLQLDGMTWWYWWEVHGRSLNSARQSPHTFPTSESAGLHQTILDTFWKWQTDTRYLTQVCGYFLYKRVQRHEYLQRETFWTKCTVCYGLLDQLQTLLHFFQGSEMISKITARLNSCRASGMKMGVRQDSWWSYSV